MPEWPEVNNVIQGFMPAIAHRPLVSITGDERIEGHDWWRPSAVLGKVVWATEQHGKLIVIHLADADWYEEKVVQCPKGEQPPKPARKERAVIACHLMMSGLLTPFPVEKKLRKHVRADLTFGPDARIRSNSGLLALNPGFVERVTDEHRREVHLRFIDPRKFGKLHIVRRPNHLQHLKSSMGPDAMALASSFRGDLATVRRFRECFKPDRSMKAVLMSQRGVAGYGNIYAAEALFAAGIAPQRTLGECADAWLALLVREGTAIMARSATLGGSTIDSYRNPDGSSGTAQTRHMVYGRSGQDCYVCGTPLKGERMDGRTTVWCPTCQL